MLRPFLFVLSLFFLNSAAIAQGSNPSDIIDKDAFQQAIYDGEFETVERIISNAQYMFDTGYASADDMRIIYQVFTTTNPKVINFTADWLIQSPDSPFAHTAQAWIYYTASWNARGEKLARQTYPYAMDEFRRMQDLAWDHAKIAYDANAEFIPASDALIRTALQTGRVVVGYETLSEVMHSNPNLGTLWRGLEMTHPGWGGSWGNVERLCDQYAPLIKGEKEDPHLYCLVYAAIQIHPKPHFKWAISQLEEGHLPSLEYLRLNYATRRNATRAEAEFARAYLSRDGYTNHVIARRFDDNIASRYGFDFIAHEHVARAQDIARDQLQHDPYDPALLNILSMPVTKTERTENGTRLTIIDEASDAELLDYAQRKLMASPFNPDYWHDYLTVVHQGLMPETYQKFDAFWINAVVFGNHDTNSIARYLTHKANAYMRLQWARDGKMDSKWDHVPGQIDEETVLICPIVRLYRLRELVCEPFEGNNVGCSSTSTYEDFFAHILADASENNQCAAERTAEPYELFFTPVAIDFDDYQFGNPG